jgi:hypothetical protein
MVQVEASWQATKKVPSYCCHKCNSGNVVMLDQGGYGVTITAHTEVSEGSAEY